MPFTFYKQGVLLSKKLQRGFGNALGVELVVGQQIGVRPADGVDVRHAVALDGHGALLAQKLGHSAAQAAERYGMPGNLVAGANIAAFSKIADAMLAYGLV